MNLPDYQFLSAPLWLVTMLHVLTLSLHFAAMNFLLGGVIVLLWAAIRNKWDEPVVAKFVRLLPSAMAATISLGVAPLLFLQLVYPKQVYAASIVSGWFWLMVIPAAIITYYALYRAAFRAEGAGRVSQLALLLALAGLLYISLVYSSVFSMAEKPGLTRSLYAAKHSGLVWNPAVGDYALRWLHMVLGAATVGGFFVGLLGRNQPAVFATGRSFFVIGMVLASLAGVAYLISLDQHLRPFMRTPAIWALTVGAVLSLGALHFFFKKKFWPSALMLFVSMLTMVYARHTVRLLKLQGAYDPASLPVVPQWSPFILFLVCFVVMLAMLLYMFRLFFRAPKPQS